METALVVFAVVIMVTFVFSFCLCRFGFCGFCVCGSVDILVVKAKARVLRDLLVAKEGEVNRVRSSFSTFFLHFQFSLSARRRVGGGERDGRDLCRCTFVYIQRFTQISGITFVFLFVLTNFVNLRFLRFLLLRLRVL